MGMTAKEISDRHNASVAAKKAADAAEKPPAAGHNSNGQLRAYVARFKALAEQQESLREDTKELAKEAKGNGFDAAAIKKVVKLEMEDDDKRSKRENAEAILDTYKVALGMLN